MCIYIVSRVYERFFYFTLNYTVKIKSIQIQWNGSKNQPTTKLIIEYTRIYLLQYIANMYIIECIFVINYPKYALQHMFENFHHLVGG